jgi:putative Mg2+ transporter-C (MgtC) family protein
MDWYLSTNLASPDWVQIQRVSIQLAAAVILGGILGLERESKGRAAGMRTHMLVALGAALFTLIPMEVDSDPNLGEAVKGVAAGVGFLGAGTILKRSDAGDVIGLTTAASIWFTAAAGLAAGARQIPIAILATVLAWVVLYALHGAERWFGAHADAK